MRLKKKMYGMFGWLMVILITGCDTDASDLQTYVLSLEDVRPQGVEERPELTIRSRQKHRPGTVHRSPFEAETPLVKASTKCLKSSDTKENPLTQTSLDALKLVGTLRHGKQRWALMQTPQGTVERVRVGDRVGLNSGVVLSVKAQALTVTERTKVNEHWVNKKKIFTLSGLKSL